MQIHRIAGASLVRKLLPQSFGKARIVNSLQCSELVVWEFHERRQPDVSRLFRERSVCPRRVTQTAPDLLLICLKRITQIQEDRAALVAVTVGG
jgi:hypothetical protein